MSNNTDDVSYIGFGHVNFPVRSPGWRDGKLGILTVRLMAAGEPHASFGSEDLVNGGVMDDVLVGTDIHSTSQDAHEFMKRYSAGIKNHQLLGHVNWLGIGTSDFWACHQEDLDQNGQKIYRSFLAQHPGQSVFLLTSLCRHPDTIKALTRETEIARLPKRHYGMDA